jgi:translocator protein
MNIALLAVSIAIAEGVGLLSALCTRSSIKTWYVVLRKPRWNPPSWVFAPAWTVLYAFMGLAAYLVYAEGGVGVTFALVVYAVQLCANGLWSVIFFCVRSLSAAFLWIVLLWCLILATILLFYALVPWSGILLLPYLLWVTFAGVLNYRVWRLNK